jgi:hypothetical protein
MHENFMRQLAARAQEGDSQAAGQFEREALPRVVPVVRRALRQDTPESSLVSRIRAVAGRMAWNHGGRLPADDDDFVFRVAQAVCAAVAPPRRARLGAQETVRC